MPRNKEFDEKDVLHKAKELFSRKGYNGTSMDELVQVTGLSRSSIYDSFGDKYSLYLKSLRHYTQQSQNVICDAIEKVPSPKKRIQIFFDNLVNTIINDKEKSGCFMVNATAELANTDKQVSEIACSNIKEMEDKFYAWVKEGQAKGEISKTNSARSLARHLYNTLTGLRVTGKALPEKTFLKDVVKTSLSILDSK